MVEAEVIELASDLLQAGRAVEVTSDDTSVRLSLKERGPALLLVVKDRSVALSWANAESVVARADQTAQVPVPADANDYAREAEEVSGR